MLQRRDDAARTTTPPMLGSLVGGFALLVVGLAALTMSPSRGRQDPARGTRRALSYAGVYGTLHGRVLPGPPAALLGNERSPWMLALGDVIFVTLRSSPGSWCWPKASADLYGLRRVQPGRLVLTMLMGLGAAAVYSLIPYARLLTGRTTRPRRHRVRIAFCSAGLGVSGGNDLPGYLRGPSASGEPVAGSRSRPWSSPPSARFDSGQKEAWVARVDGYILGGLAPGLWWGLMRELAGARFGPACSRTFCSSSAPPLPEPRRHCPRIAETLPAAGESSVMPSRFVRTLFVLAALSSLDSSRRTRDRRADARAAGAVDPTDQAVLRATPGQRGAPGVARARGPSRCREPEACDRGRRVGIPRGLASTEPTDALRLEAPAWFSLSSGASASQAPDGAATDRPSTRAASARARDRRAAGSRARGLRGGGSRRPFRERASTRRERVSGPRPPGARHQHPRERPEPRQSPKSRRAVPRPRSPPTRTTAGGWNESRNTGTRPSATATRRMAGRLRDRGLAAEGDNEVCGRATRSSR